VNGYDPVTHFLLGLLGAGFAVFVVVVALT